MVLEQPELKPKRAPTLYAIILVKVLKGLLLLAGAVAAYALSDNDLPAEFKHLLTALGQDPQRQFFEAMARKIATITQSNVLWVSGGALAYSLFSFVEGIGLVLRVAWAGWMAVMEGGIFIPLEIYELEEKGFSWGLFAVLLLNVGMVVYLVRNRHRLFRHHHQPSASEHPLQG